MGAPSSDIISGIFLQNMEHTHLTQLAQKHNIINYCMYVDNILLIFDSNQSTIQMIQNDFINIHPKSQFTSGTERDHTLNYLDIPIHRDPTGIRTTIYRKPTFTEIIIPHTTNHPEHHKHAAVRFLFNRLHSYNL